jgi:pyrroloquinoline quinone (PQQ) biosynthesis protein C
VIETTSLRKRMIEIGRRSFEQNSWLEYTKHRLTRAGAAIYVQQHGIFTRHSRRCWAYVIGNCPEVEARRFFVLENLYEEEGIEEKSHYLKLVKEGIALGLTAEQVHDAVPTLGLRAAMLIWETLTKDRHWLIGVAAKGILEMMNYPECGNFSQLQAERYAAKLGLRKDALETHYMHAELDQVHGAGSLELIEKFLPKYPEVSEQALLTAAEDSLYAMDLFQGAAAKAADAAD